MMMEGDNEQTTPCDELFQFVSGLSKTERELQWRLKFNHELQRRVLASVMGGLEPLSKKYRSGPRRRRWSVLPTPCVRDVLNYFFSCYKKQQKPAKPYMYQFVAAVAPEVFNYVAMAMKQKIDNNNDKKNLQKSLLQKWLASKVDKRVSVICMNIHGMRINKVLKLERVTKTTVYIWRFDLPAGDDVNVLVRFNICRDSVYENGFKNPGLGGMIVKWPSPAVLARIYKKTTAEELQENTPLSKNIVKLVVGFLKC